MINKPTLRSVNYIHTKCLGKVGAPAVSAVAAAIHDAAELAAAEKRSRASSRRPGRPHECSLLPTANNIFNLTASFRQKHVRRHYLIKYDIALSCW
jgi:hypothetical protein